MIAKRKMKLFTAGLLAVAMATVFAKSEAREAIRIPRSAVFKDSFGKSFVFDPMMKNFEHNIEPKHEMNPKMNDDILVRKRRLADDKRLDLKMKMQRINKVVSLDAIGSYSLYRSNDRKTSLKAFGSTVLWYNGNNFGLKKPGLGVQFTIYY